MNLEVLHECVMLTCFKIHKESFFNYFSFKAAKAFDSVTLVKKTLYRLLQRNIETGTAEDDQIKKLA